MWLPDKWSVKAPLLFFFRPLVPEVFYFVRIMVILIIGQGKKDASLRILKYKT